MPIAGRKPKAEHRHRVRPTHEWIEVSDIPFESAPDLCEDRDWPSQTRSWWSDISQMPHCVLWTRSDWQFAKATAILAAAFHAGDLRQAAELRQRGKIMGTTVEARRDLRICYVQPTVEEKPKSVEATAEYRRRLGR